MRVKEFTIGHLSKQTGCKIPTIRYYEEIGLLPDPRRSPGNRRLYSSRHIERLDFILHCRELGFSQTAIRELLTLSDQSARSCDAVTAIARTHLDDVNRRIARLSGLKSELERMVASCAGGSVDQCRIIETLADHTHKRCLTANH